METEYRIITLRTPSADQYLQFKSKRSQRCFPRFWETKEVDCWRFIPKERTHVFGPIQESSCPTSLPVLVGYDYVSDWYYAPGEYGFRFGSLMSFTREHPNIQKYFDGMNRKYQEYCARERLASQAGTTYIKKR